MKTPFTSQIRVSSLLTASTLFLSFLFTASYTNAQAPCGGGDTVYSCSNIVNLFSPGVAGYVYSWYDAHCPPAQICQSPTFKDTGVSYTTDLNDGEHYYFYEGTNGSQNCTSGIIFIRVAAFHLVPLTHDSLPCILKVNTAQTYFNDMGYYDYQWYRNGQIIPGATDTNYTAHLAGEYVLKATSPRCGVVVSQPVYVGCSATAHYTNHTFSPGIHAFTNQNVVFQGVIRIPADAHVNFTNCHINMKTGSEIIVESTTQSSQQYGGIIHIINSFFSSCGQWGGLYIQGKNINSARDSLGGVLSITNSHVGDAYVGIAANNNAILTINNNIFEFNYMHLDMRYYDGNFTCAPNRVGGPDITIQGNHFNSLLEDTTGNFSPQNMPPAPINPQDRKMIYLDRIKGIYVINNTFKSSNYTSFKENAVEVHFVSQERCNYNGCIINNNLFEGDFKDGIHVENGTHIEITNDSFIGITERCIYINNSSEVTISSNCLQNTSTSISGIGISCDQVDTLAINLNFITNHHKGIEYYHLGGVGSKGEFVENNIEYCNYGIQIAPFCDPVNNSQACSSQNVAAYLNTRYVNLYCNHIFYCNFGIVGTGDIIDQGDTSSEWETFFDDTINGISTTNYQADVVWYTNSIIKNKIFHYVAYPPQWKGNGISIDNHWIDSTNFKSNIDFQNTYNIQSCRGSFKPIFYPPVNSQPFPNPFSQFLTIPASHEWQYYQLFTADGRQVKSGRLYSEPNMLSTENLPNGIYFLKLVGHKNQKSVMLIKNE